MKKSTGVALLLTVVIAGLLAACGSDPTPTATTQPTATPLPNVTPSPTPTPLADTFQQQWDDLVAAAKQEGELVILLSGTDSVLMRSAYDTFAKEFGINVVQSTGSGSEQANRLLAELSRGVYTVDIVTSSGASFERPMEAGAFAPTAELLFHPEVTDWSTGHWFDAPFYVDSQGKYALADRINVDNIASIWYNTENVTQEELDSIHSYQDLLQPQFKGRMAARAMNAPGGKSVQARLWLAPGLGPDYLEAVYRQMDLQLVGTEEDTVLAEGVARGKWDFGLFGGGNTFQQMQNENLPVAELTAQRVLEPGLSTEITYGPAVTERAPHPNAAKLFINWYFSREGQTASQLSRAAEGPQFSTSMRSDVPQGSIPDYLYENVEQIPEWRAAGTMDEHVIVYETNDEWFAVRDAQEKFFNDLYIELGYDAWVNY